MNEAENQSSDMECKQTKDSQSEQEEKRIQENEGIISPLRQPQDVQHLHHRDARRRRESKKLEIYLKNNERKLP